MAENEARSPTQIPAVVVLILIVGVVTGARFITTVLLVTVAGVAQVMFEVRMHFTTSLLLSEAGEKLGLLLPALLPFTDH